MGRGKLNDPVGFVMEWHNRQEEKAATNKELGNAAKAVYSTYQGRVLLDQILAMLIAPSVDPDPNITYYNEGQRAVAIFVNNLLKPDTQEPNQTAALNQPEEE